MCAINGFTFSDRELIEKMNAATAHRGPDDSGVFSDEHITLGHQRLSIIDPTPAGHQPMVSADKKLVAILNGEIYNFRELKKEITGDYSFKTNSDTEVVLAAYRKWGKDCVKKFNGIFALAIWNTESKELFLARDHAGIKPLYYFKNGEKFIFSSEIKALLESGIERVIDKEAFSHYFRLLYTPSPTTLFKGIQKFPAGHIAFVKNGEVTFEQYWSPQEPVKAYTKQELEEGVRSHIEDAVARQLVSDKPVGVYLSGGIDSSIVLHNVQKTHKHIDTFSVGFDLTREEQREKFNADFFLARRTAAHYGVHHHEVLVSPSEVIDLLEKSVWHCDEPIANPTALARLKIASFAKEHVDVVLGGDGGDELFGGYERYRLSHVADLYQRYIPEFVRSGLEFHSALRKLNIPPDVKRYALFMFQKDAALREVLSETYVDDSTHSFFHETYFKDSTPTSFGELFMEADQKTWLADESLTLSDKMSMASGLEMRVPLLDPEVIKFSQTVPLHHKVGLFKTKIALKDAYRKELPTYLFNQPKRGWFSPSAKWLRHQHVYDFAKEVLSPSYYEETKDFFKWEPIERMLEDHYNQKRYNLTPLWSLMTFQLWARRFSVKNV